MKRNWKKKLGTVALSTALLTSQAAFVSAEGELKEAAAQAQEEVVTEEVVTEEAAAEEVVTEEAAAEEVVTEEEAAEEVVTEEAAAEEVVVEEAEEVDSAWKINSQTGAKWKVKEKGSTFIKGNKGEKGQKGKKAKNGKIAAQKVKSESDVREFFKANKEFFKMNSVDKMDFIQSETDDLGMTHYTYQPNIQDIPIDQSKVIVHVNEAGEIVAVNGEFHPEAPKKVKQSKEISKKDARETAWDHINIDRAEADITVNNLEGNDFDTLTETTELVVFHDDGEYTLAYHVELQFSIPEPGNWDIWVNAENGDVLQATNKVKEVASTGTGTGVLGDTKSLNTFLYNNTYYLFDTTKPMDGVIQTFDLFGGGQFNLPGSYVTDTGNTFVDERQKAAVDAHYYAGEVFDYYYDTFGRESYDDRGADITSSVHYGSNYNNAGWTGNQMIYGDGDGSLFTYLSGSKDVVGHELTHAVIDTTADLVYENQPGALNESFADVFGYFVDDEDWLLGEDIYTPNRSGDALRSLSDPTDYNQPAHMDNFRVLPNTREGDWGGVHINSGIPNKAAYHTINAIGKSKAEQIYYRALTVYLTPYSEFDNARAALIQSAEDLYGSSTADEIAAAWDSVGVY
ncbi:M4 family metallopeptidase [Bacillus solimangrovi]|uniref:Neutral metalloproteinase n=1 Tax=Bacillus solimangrovi TaxID=1305675 RepID=A0A1E5LHK4_9BACI|nr:M4 family metallopeptidase [Bacillus solimangrovi]OEH93572.1 peptidase M4 [Bacillus solimangrovi]